MDVSKLDENNMLRFLNMSDENLLSPRAICSLISHVKHIYYYIIDGYTYRVTNLPHN